MCNISVKELSTCSRCAAPCSLPAQLPAHPNRALALRIARPAAHLTPVPSLARPKPRAAGTQSLDASTGRPIRTPLRRAPTARRIWWPDFDNMVARTCAKITPESDYCPPQPPPHGGHYKKIMHPNDPPPPPTNPLLGGGERRIFATVDTNTVPCTSTAVLCDRNARCTVY